jgi:hypothetical protein
MLCCLVLLSLIASIETLSAQEVADMKARLADKMFCPKERFSEIGLPNIKVCEPLEPNHVDVVHCQDVEIQRWNLVLRWNKRHEQCNSGRSSISKP